MAYGGMGRGPPTVRAAMFDKVPLRFKLMAGVGLLLAGPVTLFAFLLGGSVAGAAVILAIALFYTVLYIVGVRKYI